MKNFLLREFRQYFVEKLSVKRIGEVSRGILVGYKPCFSLNSASTGRIYLIKLRYKGIEFLPQTHFYEHYFFAT